MEVELEYMFLSISELYRLVIEKIPEDGCSGLTRSICGMFPPRQRLAFKKHAVRYMSMILAWGFRDGKHLAEDGEGIIKGSL